MNKDCSIVQDLLPLYAEDMLREETKEFVDGHLVQCEACRTELTALRAEVAPASVSAQPLRDLKKQLQRKRFTAVLLAVTLALTLATAGFAYLTAPQYLPYNETEWMITRSPRALADGSIMADGLTDLSGIESISVNLLTPVSGTEVTSTQEPDSGRTVYFITAWRTPLDTWRGAFDKTGDAPNARSANDRTQREADALQGGVRAHALHARHRELRSGLLFSEQRAGRCAALRQHERRHHFSAAAGARLLRFAIIGASYSAEYCLFPLPQEKDRQTARPSRADPRVLSHWPPARQGLCDDELPDAARFFAHCPHRRAPLCRGAVGRNHPATAAGRSRIKKKRHRQVSLLFLAQREGFEPSCDCSQTDFE